MATTRTVVGTLVNNREFGARYILEDIDRPSPEGAGYSLWEVGRFMGLFWTCCDSIVAEQWAGVCVWPRIRCSGMNTATPPSFRLSIIPIAHKGLPQPTDLFRIRRVRPVTRYGAANDHGRGGLL